MNDIKNLLIKYLNSPKPPPYLAAMFEQAPDWQELTKLGFDRQGDYWVISRKDAEKALQTLTGLSFPDISEQFEYERTQREKLFQEVLNKQRGE